VLTPNQSRLVSATDENKRMILDILAEVQLGDGTNYEKVRDQSSVVFRMQREEKYENRGLAPVVNTQLTLRTISTAEGGTRKSDLVRVRPPVPCLIGPSITVVVLLSGSCIFTSLVTPTPTFECVLSSQISSFPHVLEHKKRRC